MPFWICPIQAVPRLFLYCYSTPDFYQHSSTIKDTINRSLRRIFFAVVIFCHRVAHMHVHVYVCVYLYVCVQKCCNEQNVLLYTTRIFIPQYLYMYIPTFLPPKFLPHSESVAWIGLIVSCSAYIMKTIFQLWWIVLVQLWWARC